jgi:hypothetical protein
MRKLVAIIVVSLALLHLAKHLIGAEFSVGAAAGALYVALLILLIKDEPAALAPNSTEGRSDRA